MGKTNRDQARNRQTDTQRDEGDYALRKQSKKKQKRDRRNVEKSLNDAVLSGEYDEYELEDEFYSDETWDG